MTLHDFRIFAFYVTCITLPVMLFRLLRGWQKMSKMQRRQGMVDALNGAAVSFFLYGSQKPHWELSTSIAAGIVLISTIYSLAIGGATTRKPLPKDV